MTERTIPDNLFMYGMLGYIYHDQIFVYDVDTVFIPYIEENCKPGYPLACFDILSRNRVIPEYSGN